MDKQLLDIQKELLEYFPDGFYTKQSEIRKLHVEKKINNYIYRQKTYNKKNITFSQVLTEIGLKKADYYDVKRMRYIHEKFDITYERWGCFFGGIKRQAIELVMNKNTVRDYFQWSNIDLKDSDYKFIQKELIQKNKYLAFDAGNDRTYFLVNNISEASIVDEARLILLIREGDKKTGKVYLNEVEDSLLERPLRKAGYFEISLTAIDDYRAYIRFLNNKSKNKKYLTKDEDNELKRWVNRSIFKNEKKLLEKNHISSEILYSNLKLKTDEEGISSKFDKYADDNGIVIIPYVLEDGRQNSDYTSIHRIAKDKGFDSIEELAASYGYTFVSNETIRNLKNEENFQEGLEKRTVGNNNVYINTLDPFYNFVRRRSMNESYSTMNEYLIENYNLNRIFKEDLRDADEMYKWTNDLDESLLDRNSLYDYLKQYINEDGILDESTSGRWYRRVYYHSFHYNKSVPDVLRSFDLEYTEKSIIQEEVSEIDELLKELDYLNSELEKTTTSKEKYKRNRELVKRLKRLYNYQCQCCGKDQVFPPIITNKNIPYVEVHHIRPLASKEDAEWTQAGNDESTIILDHYMNCLVVCPYHHKQIHFENSGYFNFDRENLRIYNRANEFIQIYHDLHLRKYN
ncbi:hypothetical protein ACTQ5R_09700 [Ruoffia tabacinasalis]|uniref:hypothetical protein n=1 Tax=Ruoffia tabacinasalis TaxID=87458 RepID=UPI003F9AAE0E